MGARILPQVPKQQARLPEQLVACRQLEASQSQLGAGKGWQAPDNSVAQRSHRLTDNLSNKSNLSSV